MDPTEPRPGTTGRRREALFRAARVRRGGEAAPISTSEQAVAKGAEGEERLGRELIALAQEFDLGVLHDLTLPGGKANIDHLVIGPAGVAVVDAKAWSGRVQVQPTMLWQGRRPRRNHVEGVDEQVVRVRDALDKAGLAHVPVDGLLCMVNANRGVPPRGITRCLDVGVGTIPSVRMHVSRPGELDLPQIWKVNDALQEHFVVHGGTYVPGQQPAMPPTLDQVAPVEVLLQKINDEQRALPAPRRWRRRLIGALAAFALLAGVGVIAQPPGQAAPKPLERGDLKSISAELRALARDRARGSVRGPRVRTSSTHFELLYRRAKRCRVRIVVRRTDGTRAIRAADCAR